MDDRLLALPLLVPRILADDTEDTLTTNRFALSANCFY